MSIRRGLLALLDKGPRYGSQLRTDFESRTGSTWTLNVGQVYTTLARLERDGLVRQQGRDGAGHPLYAITGAGRAELRDWYATPVPRTSPPRDELAIKLAMAVEDPETDVVAVVRAQRRHTLHVLRGHIRAKEEILAARPAGPEATARLIVLEQLIAHAEAEARWLDHCESTLAAHAEYGTGPV